jgi:hypothetical protein
VVPRVIRTVPKHVTPPLASDVTVVAAPVVSLPGRPDLAVTDVRTEYDSRNDSNEAGPRVTATLKNLGKAPFRSDEGAQVFVLYKDGELVARQDFETLKIGHTLNLSVEAQPEPGVYEARVLFADDIRRDGNPFNDDVNPQNDGLSRELDFGETVTVEK